MDEQSSVIQLIQMASLRMGLILAGLWPIAGKQLPSLLPLRKMISFRSIMLELLEKLVGVTVIAETKDASPGCNWATSSVVNAVIQNKPKNAAVTTRLRVAIRFHNCIAISFFLPRVMIYDNTQVLRLELT